MDGLDHEKELTTKGEGQTRKGMEENSNDEKDNIATNEDTGGEEASETGSGWETAQSQPGSPDNYGSEICTSEDAQVKQDELQLAMNRARKGKGKAEYPDNKATSDKDEKQETLSQDETWSEAIERGHEELSSRFRNEGGTSSDDRTQDLGLHQPKIQEQWSRSDNVPFVIKVDVVPKNE